MYKDADDGNTVDDNRIKDDNKIEDNDDGKLVTVEEKVKKKEGRIPLPWDLLQPILRILGHCLMGVNNDKAKK
ncbi:hypothetical protein L6164_008462 [Bauhinia variegata]|uniref:Uncharacterized protein n=1 Tax=Bauhinia variegata TaxID=167791 RepID=A0ACB9PJM2_BAUVA|nr:hypothetical protein L6164_008462 [Bauhinia variegata]